MEIASAYILAYSIAYFASVAVKEPVLQAPFGHPSRIMRASFLLIGVCLVICALWAWWPLVLAVGIFEAFTVTMQWWHLIVWRIPGLMDASPIHQVSMSLTNLACAVALFSLL